jgi:hypothetical protein
VQGRFGCEAEKLLNPQIHAFLGTVVSPMTQGTISKLGRRVAVVALAAIMSLQMAGLVPDVQTAEAAHYTPMVAPPYAVSPAFGYPGEPVYDVYPAPSGLAGATNAPEPTIGISWKTDNVMYKAFANTYRVLFDDTVSPPAANWYDASPPFNVESIGGVGLDPMLHTDPISGRTWSGNLAGYCSSMSYSDDDGQNWVPMEGPCTNSAGVDHQSIGSGPWSNVPANPGAAYPRSVYYCAQTSAMSCSVSYDGGLTFVSTTAPAVTGCGGLHGHIRVGPDGTVYVPNKRCNGRTGMVVSTQNGMDPTWAVRTVSCTAPCGNGGFDPSIGISTSGWLYIAQAESSGVWVGLSKNKGVAWETLGANHVGVVPPVNPLAPPGPACAAPASANTPYLDLGSLICPNVRAGAFVDVQAGDDERAVVTFLGSRADPTVAAANSCAAPSDVHEWHLYVAHTFDAGRTWSVKQITTHPVQIGGMFDGGFTPAGSPCRNLLDFQDMDLDSKGRVHVGFADGCLPTTPCGPGAAGTTSRSAYATIARQTTGCGLFGAYDKPYPNACDVLMDRGWQWLGPQPIAGPNRTDGKVTIETPTFFPTVTYKHTDAFTITGKVQRDAVPTPIALADVDARRRPGFDIFDGTSITITEGQEYNVVADIVGGSGDYICHWGSDQQLDITEDLNCLGTGIHAHHVGTSTLRFEAFDRYDHKFRVAKTITVNTVADTRVARCLDNPQVTDPELDTNLGTAAVGNGVVENKPVDIKAICVQQVTHGPDGMFDVIMLLRDLEPFKPAGRDDPRTFNYGVLFCLDHNGPICYAADIDSNNVRRAGVYRSGVTPGNVVQDFDTAGRICSLPGILQAGADTHIDINNDIVRFRFLRAQFDVTAPPAACPGPLARGGLKVLDGTTLSSLRGGTADDNSYADRTAANTGRQRTHQFFTPGVPEVLGNAKGVYYGEPGVTIPLDPVVTGGLLPRACKWITPNSNWANAVYLSPKSSPSFDAPYKADTCGATQLRFKDPGLYLMNFTVWDSSGGQRTDRTLFMIAYPSGHLNTKWEEHVQLKWDDRVILAPAIGDYERWVDTRYKTTDTFSLDVDLNALALANLRYVSPGTHTITATWFDHDGTNVPNNKILDKHSVTVLVVWPKELGSPKPTFPGPSDVMEGVDDDLGGVDSDGDGVDDRDDTCPGIANRGDDRDLDGILDECDDDIDGDGILNKSDNCLYVSNPDQRDTNLDGYGDACDVDFDGDGVKGADNCPFVPNADQADLDNDGIGDACDADIDGDSVANFIDAFPLDRLEWRDTDGDGIGDNSDLDIDGDGYSNTEELAAGTDPNDRLSRPQPVQERGELQQPKEAAKSKAGWTMMIVLLVVGILVAVVFAALSGSRRKP